MWFWLAMIAWGAVIGSFALNRTLGLSTSTRLLTYLLGIPAVACVGAAAAGIGDDCPAEATDCDLVGLGGTLLGVFVVVVGFGAAIVFEAIRAFLRATDR